MTARLATSIRLIQQAIAAEYGEKARKLSTTPTQIEVLRALLSHGPMTQKGIIDKTGIDRSSLSELLRRLVNQHLVAQVRLESDLRALMVTITPAGREALTKADHALLWAESAVLRKVPAGQRPVLLRLLEKACA